ncbi:hypothetical protein [Pectobacterium carotovorum]|nr:hypothetical protein [Pectobacterium carotovorum]ULS49473.1 hypothetical protein GBN63_06555 [Pectobacterium carotovorum]
MVKKDKTSKKLKLLRQREKYIEYQNRRKEKLDRLGDKKVSIRLDKNHYDQLLDLCEILGYRRPEVGKYNLIETYTGVMKYLMRVSNDVTAYRPKTERSQKLLHLHQLVSHLKHELNLSDEEILNELENKGIHIPLSPLENTVKKVTYDELRPLDNNVIRRDKFEFVEDLLCEEKVVEQMIEIDKKTHHFSS